MWRMLQPRRRSDLAQKALRPNGSRELGVQHLHGDLSVMPHVVREVDRCHPARAKLALDPVAAIHGRAERGVWRQVALG